MVAMMAPVSGSGSFGGRRPRALGRRLRIALHFREVGLSLAQIPRTESLAQSCEIALEFAGRIARALP